MKTKMFGLTSLMTVAAMTLAAMPAEATSFCLGICFQSGADGVAADPSIGTVTQTNSNVQTCAGNVQIGVSVHGDNQQCQQTNYSCNANAANGAGSNCTKPAAD